MKNERCQHRTEQKPIIDRKATKRQKAFEAEEIDDRVRLIYNEYIYLFIYSYDMMFRNEKKFHELNMLLPMTKISVKNLILKMNFVESIHMDDYGLFLKIYYFFVMFILMYIIDILDVGNQNINQHINHSGVLTIKMVNGIKTQQR